MAKLTQKEKADLMDEFINENSLWHDFIEFIETKGYSEDELLEEE